MPKVSVDIVGDSRSVERAFARSAKSAEKFNRSVTASGTNLRKFSALRGTLVGSGIALGLRNITEAAAESEQVLGQTSVAVESAGLSWQDYGKNIEAAIQAQSRFGFDDEALLRTFSLFIRQSHDVDEALRRNRIAMDVSRARFIDLESAANLVNKAALGQAGALRRVGIDARKGASGVELLAQLERQFGGSAQAASDDASTSMERFNVQIENLKESLGNLLLPVVSNLANRLGDAATKAQVLVDNLQDLGQVKIPEITIPIREVKVGGERIGDIVGRGIREGTENALAQFDPGIPAARDFFDWLVQQGGEAGRAAGVAAGDNFATALREHLDVKRREMEALPRTRGPEPVIPGEADRRAQLRNQIFDARIARQLNRVEDLGLRKQLVRLRQIGQEIRAEIAIRKDKTRQLSLADDLLNVQRQQRSVLAEIASNERDAAEAAKRRAEAAAEAAKRRAEAAAAARAARQFRALRLGPTGEELVPGVAALRRRLARVDDAVRGTFLDTDKTRSLLRGMRRVLSGGLGQVSREVRDKIEEMLAGIDRQLAEHRGRRLAKFRVVDPDSILRGLGLPPNAERALRDRLARLGPGGTIPAAGRAAFGMPVAGMVVNLYGDVVTPDSNKFIRDMQKKASKTRAQQRGARPGVALGGA